MLQVCQSRDGNIAHRTPSRYFPVHLRNSSPPKSNYVTKGAPGCVNSIARLVAAEVFCSPRASCNQSDFGDQVLGSIDALRLVYFGVHQPPKHKGPKPRGRGTTSKGSETRELVS